MFNIKQNLDMLKGYFHLFSKNDQWYGYANVRNRLWKLSDEEVKIISSFQEGMEYDEIDKNLQISSGSAKEVISSIIDNIQPTSKSTGSDRLPDVKSMILLVSEGCNFACTYCFGQYGEKTATMDEKTALASVDLAVKLGVTDLGFFGGEPLLNFPLIKTVTEYVEKNNLPLGLGITTNGSLATDEIAKYFKEHKIHVSVSMDGTESEHNKTRVFRDGRPTFKDVEKGITHFKNHGVLDMLEITYSAQHSPDLRMLLEGACSLHNVVSCACVDGRKGCLHQKDVVKGAQLVGYYNHMMDMALDPKLADSNISIIGVKELYYKIGRGELQQPPHICSDIGRRVVVSADGSVHPCPETIQPEYCIGNVNDLDFSTNFHTLRKNTLEKLSSKRLNPAWFSYLCETCIQHVSEDPEKGFVLQDPEGFGECVEEVLIRFAKENEV